MPTIKAQVKKLKLEGKNISNLRGKVRGHLSQELAEINKLVREVFSEGHVSVSGQPGY